MDMGGRGRGGIQDTRQGWVTRGVGGGVLGVEEGREARRG